MNENDILKGRLKDLANAAFRQNRYTYTNFLSAADMEVFYSNLEQLSFAGYTIFGGRESCDRVMIAFGNEADCGYAPAFPICTMKVSAVSDKFSDDLNHRDFLGALMNLGIEREMVGDILVTESTHSGKHNNAYIFCVDTVADYIAENLTKIRHTNVKCTFCSTQDTDEIQIKKNFPKRKRIFSFCRKPVDKLKSACYNKHIKTKDTPYQRKADNEVKENQLSAFSCF